jgi:hypothetical protein
MKNKRITLRINKTRGSFFENINKINKPLAKLPKEKQKTQIRDDKGYMTTNVNKIQRIIRE